MDIQRRAWTLVAPLAALLASLLGGACDDDVEDLDAGRAPDAGPTTPVSRVGLELLVDGLTSPVALLESPDGTGRLFVVDQIGIVRVLRADGQLLLEPFLDLSDDVVELREAFDERGLLGFAFHPDFGSDGRVFVHYSAPLRANGPVGYDHTARIVELTCADPVANVCAVAMERVVLEVDQPQFNHDGGTIAFGPDRLLYIGLGDGGGANDVGLGHPAIGNGQDITTLLGSILRIDVDGGAPYRIPADNPFVGRAGLDEIFAYGLRNPYRFSFDRAGDRELFVGDAGQNRFEEVDIVTRGGNYGWNIREGTTCFDPQEPDVIPPSCPSIGAQGEPLVDPILEYPNIALGDDGLGTAVIGGFVYRGRDIPGLVGEYVFGDFGAIGVNPVGRVFASTRPTGTSNAWQMRELAIANDPGGSLGSHVLSFGEDASGELYLLVRDVLGPTGQTGKVYRFIAAEDVPPPPPLDGGVDAGAPDGGVDAGPPDGGVDAGPPDAGPDPVVEQRTAGMALFGENCARCHGATGMGTSLAPALVGPGALPLDPPPSRTLRTGQFRTALDVYEFASVNMPFDAPGSLPDQTYVDILAWVLFANGFQLTDPLTTGNADELIINP